MSKLFVCDTNVILRKIESLQEYNVVLLSHVLIELDKHKSSSNKELAYKARKATRYIKANRDKFTFDSKIYNGSLLGEGYTNKYEDYNIIQACLKNNYGIITEDVLLSYVAEGFGIEVVDLDDGDNDDIYSGVHEVYMLPDEYNDFFNNRLDLNEFDLLTNQYLVVKDDIGGELLDAFVYDGRFYSVVNTKGFSTKSFGTFKPYDLYQACALNSLQKNQMTMIRGHGGTGKSLISLNYAMQQIEKQKYSKLICFVNPIATLNSVKLGYYPGTKDEKILGSSVGSMLGSKFGDRFQVESLIANNQLLLLPFSDIRGFDTTGMNAIVYIIEAQNLDVDLMKLAIQRIGDDCKLIIDGDFDQQVDSANYEGVNNGMRRASEIFRGEDYYGEVELPIIYRSKLASKAEEM